MQRRVRINWSDPESAWKELARNWRNVPGIAWHRELELKDADILLVRNMTSPDSGILTRSNAAEIIRRLQPSRLGEAQDVVFENQSHLPLEFVTGFSVRVRKPDWAITEAFREFCRIEAALEANPVLNPADYSARKYRATLRNYRQQMWGKSDLLPDGWDAELYRHFARTNQNDCIDSPYDQGGWIPRERIIQALETIGLLQPESDAPLWAERST